MRNVSRTAKPISLKKNANKWTQELLDELQRNSGDSSKVADKFFNKYNKSDVKAALDEMYNNLCCYCESEVGVVDFPHIEHRMPKRKYPQETFNWDNLHLACGKCNGYKGNHFDSTNPILDAVKDVPISDHLSYSFVADKVLRTPESKRGETTARDANLDRDRLASSRSRVLFLVLDVIKKINKNPNSPKNITRRKKLELYCKMQYGSLVEFAMKTFMSRQ